DYDIYTQPYVLHEYGWIGNSYYEGTVNLTNGSDIVDGIGTEWKQEHAGQWFGVEGDIEAYKVDGKVYKISEIISPTQLRLSETYRGSTNHAGALTYKINPYFLYYGHADGSKERDFEEFTSVHKGWPCWGIRHVPYSYTAGLDFWKPYQSINGHSMTGIVLAAMLLEDTQKTKTLWNHNVLFDYIDRYTVIYKYCNAKYKGDNPEPPEGITIDIPGLNDRTSWDEFIFKRYGFIPEMWDTYRSLCGPEYRENQKRNPVAVIKTDVAEGEPPLEVAFDGTFSSSYGGSITAYEWDFNNDGTTDATDAKISWIFNEPGTCIVTLIVTDSMNLSGRSECMVLVTQENDDTRAVDESDTTQIDEELGDDLFGVSNNIIKTNENSCVRIIISSRVDSCVVIYDAHGGIIREIQRSSFTNGAYYWDGTGSSGDPVGSGIYFLKLKDQSSGKTKKIAVVR
ncbi:MAG: PKD domain-containing protein, partial [Elusimicrobia bacterium]|nr:PKD domain-containing protein [Elusimicrobiota bacterium]